MGVAVVAARARQMVAPIAVQLGKQTLSSSLSLDPLLLLFFLFLLLFLLLLLLPWH